MCQVNTEPMMSQTHLLQVVGKREFVTVNNIMDKRNPYFLISTKTKRRYNTRPHLICHYQSTYIFSRQKLNNFFIFHLKQIEYFNIFVTILREVNFEDKSLYPCEVICIRIICIVKTYGYAILKLYM